MCAYIIFKHSELFLLFLKAPHREDQNMEPMSEFEFGRTLPPPL